MTTSVKALTTRKSYIDVAKGLLILMVVWGHFELMCRVCYNISHPYISRFDWCENLWAAFFMPAFFFITGLCSNFTRPFKQFLLTGLKTILLPGFIICYTTQLCDYLTMDVTPLWIVKTMAKAVMLQGPSGEWFLVSLFLARIALWALVRVRLRLRLVIAAAVFIIGLVLYNTFSEVADVWFFKHAAMALLFMTLGFSLKTDIKIYYKWWWVYLPLIVATLSAGLTVPFLTNRVNIDYSFVPLFLVLSLSGILFVLGLSRMIDHSPLLEFLGRNSLVIFLVHFLCYRAYLLLAIPWLSHGGWVTAVSILVVYGINVATCCGAAWLLNLRPFRWILGK